MANVKTIEGYNIKDATARADIAELRNYIPQFQSGTLNHRIKAPQSAEDITFPKSFSSVPKVFLSIVNDEGVRIETWVRDVSRSGFTAVIFSEAISQNTDVTIQWFAVK